MNDSTRTMRETLAQGHREGGAVEQGGRQGGAARGQGAPDAQDGDLNPMLNGAVLVPLVLGLNRSEGLLTMGSFAPSVCWTARASWRLTSSRHAEAYLLCDPAGAS